jgi:lysozyme
MRTSEATIEMIAEFEGFVDHPYNDFGNTAIGFGHTVHLGPPTPIDASYRVTRGQALALLKQDLTQVEIAVEDYVIVSLNQNEFDALVSFTFNLGIGALRGSTLLDLLNTGKRASAAREFGKWINAGGQPLEGLRRRRAAEAALFRKPVHKEFPLPKAEYHKTKKPHRKLNTGERGADVKQLQIAINRELRKMGAKARVAVDGEFGAQTLKQYRKVAHRLGLDHTMPTQKSQLLVRQPFRRDKRLKKQAEERRPKPKPQISKYFGEHEFDCNDGTPFPSYMKDDLKVLCERILDPLREKYGPGSINSGYRHTRYNASIGGEPNSFHIYDVRKSQPAADATFSRGNANDWGAESKRLRARAGRGGGVGTYPSSRFVHNDTRTYNSDWWG